MLVQAPVETSELEYSNTVSNASERTNIAFFFSFQTSYGTKLSVHGLV